MSPSSWNTFGSIHMQVPQSMQVLSTKKSPGTFSGLRVFALAMGEAG
jgi:hypothetical protein